MVFLMCTKRKLRCVYDLSYKYFNAVDVVNYRQSSVFSLQMFPFSSLFGSMRLSLDMSRVTKWPSQSRKSHLSSAKLRIIPPPCSIASYLILCTNNSARLHRMHLTSHGFTISFQLVHFLGFSLSYSVNLASVWQPARP